MREHPLRVTLEIPLQVRCLQLDVVLCFQASHGDSLDNMALRENIDDQEGEDRDNRASHHQCPLRGILSAELVEHQRHGKVRRRIEHDQRPEKVVPQAYKGENTQSREWSSQQRQYDLPENCPAIRSIHNGRLLQLNTP